METEGKRIIVGSLRDSGSLRGRLPASPSRLVRGQAEAQRGRGVEAAQQDAAAGEGLVHLRRVRQADVLEQAGPRASSP
jgi:hypothetical protein